MALVILVIWPQVEGFAEELGGQMVGDNAYVFPASKAAAVKGKLSQWSADTNLSVIEISGVAAFKLGMATMGESGEIKVFQNAFPQARSYY